VAIVRPPGFIDALQPRQPSFALSAPIEPRAVPIWLWWNLLSLDAPTVAVVWALLLARTSGIPLRSSQAVALALVVWFVYSLDRLLDASLSNDSRTLQARHRFCIHHANLYIVAMGTATAVTVSIVLRNLEPREIWNGIKLGSVVAGYLVAIHARSGRAAKYLPKEVFVGILFAAGTTLPLWSHLHTCPRSILLAWVCFALVCILNCTAIECWETPKDRAASRRSPGALVRWCDGRIGQLALLVVLLSLAPVLMRAPGHPAPAFLSVSLAAVFLFAIDCHRARFSSAALRVLADAALVFPVLLILGLL
jgi:hypothetical protein